MAHIFRFRVLRHNFFAAVAVVAVVIMILSFATYQWGISSWADAFYNQSAEAFFNAESQLRAAGGLADTLQSQCYENALLMEDLIAFGTSDSESEYLLRRQEISLSSDQQIVSFPEAARRQVYRHQTGLTSLDIRFGEEVNRIVFSPNGVELQFRIAQTENHSDSHYQMTRQMWNFPTLRSILCEMVFTFDWRSFYSEGAFSSAQFAVLVDSAGNELYLANREGTAEIIEQFAGLDLSDSTYHRGADLFYFYALHSNEHQYRLQLCTTSDIFIRERAMQILAILVTYAVSAVTLLLFYAGHLRHNAIFIDRIMTTIDQVQHGKFDLKPSAIPYRNNEYGLIAKQIDQMSAELSRYITTNYKLRLKQQETEMRMLQNQINPHFLYNTLESIRAMAQGYGDGQTADAIANLGALYRNIVRPEENFTIANELTFLRKYLDIMELKYPNNFSYQIDFPDELMSFPTFKFWMQPLAENFFKHGFNEDDPFNLLIINGETADHRIFINVIDNGASLSEERLAEINRSITEEPEHPSGSIGLNNVYTRLSYFYGPGLQFYMKNNEEGGVRIVIEIPNDEGVTGHV